MSVIGSTEKLLAQCRANILHFRLEIREGVQFSDPARVQRAEGEIQYWQAWASRYENNLEYERKTSN